jgi:hypothetical protein
MTEQVGMRRFAIGFDTRTADKPAVQIIVFRYESGCNRSDNHR